MEFYKRLWRTRKEGKMSKFIEINEHLIDMDEIKVCYFNKEKKSSDIKFIITLKDNTKIDLSTNRFWDNSYEHSCKNMAGYEKIKEYLLNKENENKE